jgi:outer membrane receptor for ferric coprogen and ferric-rhodotorulic acid
VAAARLIVLFFTQSRGTLAGVELESAIDRLLIKGDIDGYRSEMLAKDVAENSFKQYEGIYWDEDADTGYYSSFKYGWFQWLAVSRW